MTTIPPKREVSPRELREMFNRGGYEAKLHAGELTEHVVKQRHPSAPKAPVPYCTKSQLVQYRDATGSEVVTFHRYLQPDGTLGASGQPDPKRILRAGVLYIAWWATELRDM
jgi:hypothetical protein